MYRLLILVALAAACATRADEGGDDPERRLQIATMADLRTIGAGLEWYGLDHGTFPVLAETRVADLDELLVDSYLSRLPAHDAWGRPFRVISSGASFVIWSAGRDGVDDSRPPGGPQTDPDADIVYASHIADYGYFWQGLSGRCGVSESPWLNPIPRIRAEVAVLVRLGCVE